MEWLEIVVEVGGEVVVGEEQHTATHLHHHLSPPYHPPVSCVMCHIQRRLFPSVLKFPSVLCVGEFVFATSVERNKEIW